MNIIKNKKWNCLTNFIFCLNILIDFSRNWKIKKIYNIKEKEKKKEKRKKERKRKKRKKKKKEKIQIRNYNNYINVILY